MSVRGCYGLELLGLPFPDDGLCALPVGSPTLEVRLAAQLADLRPSDRVEVLQLLEGHLALNADSSVATFAVPQAPAPSELLHPWLAQAAINRSLALQRLVLHGGLLEVAGRGAVALLGHREAGKSTLVAHAAAAGLSVLSDDVIVLDGDLALTGPRCIDLRAPSAARLRRDVTPARGGTRWRMALPEAAWSSRLAAVVVLEWGDRLALTSLPARERLAALDPHLACAPTPRARLSLLGAASLPVLRLVRPRDFDLLDAAVDLVLEAA